MLRWPLGEGEDLVQRMTVAFTYVLEHLMPHGMVHAAPDSHGAAIWIPPDGEKAADEAWSQPRLLELADDGGRRYADFWEWVYERYPDEPHWDLDSVAVEAAQRGRGLGSALVRAGLDLARAAGTPAFLATGTEANASLYTRAGFRVVEDADPPARGPHVWFMRWDP